MALTVLPTKTDGSIGRVKTETPVSSGLPVDLDYYESATEHERMKDALIGVCAEVGLSDGSTVGSLVYRVEAIEGGAIPTDVIALAEQGSAPAALSNSVKVYAKDNGGTSALYARTDDGVEHELTGAAASAEWPVTQLTASDTLTAVSQIVEVDATLAAVVLALPAASAAEGVRYIFVQTDGSENTVELDPDGTDDVAGAGAGVNYTLPGSGVPGAWSLYSNGTGWLRSDYVTPIPAMGAIDGLRLTEQSGDPSATANEGKLYTKDVGGVTHFFAILSDGTIIRLTGTATAAAALGRAASAGTLGSVANADHVHDGAAIAMSSVITTDVALPDADVVRVSSASGNRILDLGATVTGAPRKMCDLLKTNTETNTIALSPGGSQTINGGTAGADLVLPDSDSADRPGWTVYRDTDGNFLVY